MIVGLSGYARSGKDTAARHLIEQGWRRDAFADRLRDFLYGQNPIVLYPVPGGVPEYTRLSILVDDIGWERAKLESPEVADLLLRTGTEAGRRVLGEHVWVNAVFDSYRPGENLVITDCRFPNEADRVREMGGIVVRINRHGVGPRRTSTGELHVSDVALDEYPFDWIFDNDGTEDDLHALIGYMVRVERNVA
ncbi:deoxynucleoside monophosphate kinase [Streptomyces phage Celia]|uniref:Deoxynucleoside monophosphate kinase n=1 Tax=Streptomyces phage Celia TaxID=2590946 RepID=A0A516KRE9_9CAUD|nr:deoxynucleoside monophosphate kinase [Streptomyces phage Celia]QDP44262.1 deoxynucleoside monophosphate kinase [Streptomyces phage Celia]QJD50627.1 deoxynucleoside monophosphate kinase [Streptomyces phage Itza]